MPTSPDRLRNLRTRLPRSHGSSPSSDPHRLRLLKWAGGKRWLVPSLSRIWSGHSHRRLVEPLCGGLAATLGLMPRRALLNDINPHTINFYRWLKRGLRITLRMDNDEELYYAHRKQFNRLIARGGSTSRRAAELFYYLNRTGYNGLCRFSRSGEFNVPFGRYTTINYDRDFVRYSEIFAEWEFSCGDFEDVEIRPGDFIYADPPYDVEFTQYSREGFGWNDQERLARWLARHSGPVVLSNQATERIRKLYTRLGFEVALLRAPRMISCNGDRTPAWEVLATRGL
ncbi:MAG: DNA adenine methylase [Acidobacteriota bacterium]